MQNFVSKIIYILNFIRVLDKIDIKIQKSEEKKYVSLEMKVYNLNDF